MGAGGVMTKKFCLSLFHVYILHLKKNEAFSANYRDISAKISTLSGFCFAGPLGYVIKDKIKSSRKISIVTFKKISQII